MVKPLRPRKSQDLWVPSLVWIMIGLPRGYKGVALNLNGPLNFSQADMAGEMLDWQRRLRVSSVCGRIFPQSNFRDVLDTLVRIDIKWALKVYIICSAALRRCMLGGTSWKVDFHFSYIWSL